MAESPLASPPEVLRREADVFTRYLVGRGASEYVASKYRDGHRVIPYRDGTKALPVDALLMRVARQGVLPVWLADGYARMFRRSGPLRQKLVLLTAILESSPSFHEDVSGSNSMGRLQVYIGLLGIGFGFALRLALAMLMFGPVQLLGGLNPANSRLEAPGPDG